MKPKPLSTYVEICCHYFFLRFLFKFTGEESEINLDGDENERAEFSAWKWASTEEVLERVLLAN